MTDLDLDEQLFVHHLQVCMDQVHADLDHTTRVATRAGLRMRRRRRVARGLAAAACVGVAGATFAGLATTDGADPARSDDLRPSASRTPASPCVEGVPSEEEAAKSGLRVRCLPLTAGDERALELHLAGWHCDAPAEQRMTCSDGSAEAVVVWRRLPTYATPAHGKRPPTPLLVGNASEHPAGSVVGRMGDRFFYAVEPGPGLSEDDLYAVTDAIRLAAG